MVRLSDIAKRARIADSTARRYVNAFPEWFPSRIEGRARVYDPEAVAILLQVAKWYSEGLSTQAIRDHLAREHTATVNAVNAVDIVRPELGNVEQALIVIASQRQELDRLRDDVRELRERLDNIDRRPWWRVWRP